MGLPFRRSYNCRWRVGSPQSSSLSFWGRHHNGYRIYQQFRPSSCVWPIWLISTWKKRDIPSHKIISKWALGHKIYVLKQVLLIKIRFIEIEHLFVNFTYELLLRTHSQMMMSNLVEIVYPFFDQHIQLKVDYCHYKYKNNHNLFNSMEI